MQLRSLLTLLICIFSYTILWGQTGSMSYKATNKPLSDALKEITELYGVKFAYSSDKIDVKQKITVDIKNQSLEDFMKQLLSHTGIWYSTNANVIALEKQAIDMHSISGYIRDSKSGELLPGVIVRTAPLLAGCISNNYGYYIINVPAGVYQLQLNYFGYKNARMDIDLTQESIQLDIKLESNTDLQEIVIEDETNKKLAPDMIQVNTREISQIPSMLGEKDAVKYMQLMSGVQKGNEGNSHLYVRGGAADQNLILIDDAVIYNAYHYLGLASLFSGNELKNATLTKGGFSSRHGGRISSVLDMTMKEGNREKMGFDATIGMISSRILVEGPLKKNKASFLFSFRKSYLNQASKILAQNSDEELNYNYTDFHAKISTQIFKRSALYISTYLGQDVLLLSNDPQLIALEEGVKWGNKALTVRYNQPYGKKAFSNTALVYSSYSNRTSLGQTGSGLSLTTIQSVITDYTLKHDIDYAIHRKHYLKMGAAFTMHALTPSASIYTKDSSKTEEKLVSTVNSIPELNLYLEDHFTVHPKHEIFAGVRATRFQNKKTFYTIEPRLRYIYQPGGDWTIHSSYSEMNQFLQMISTGGGIGIPMEQWNAADAGIAPSKGYTTTLGVSKNSLFKKQISISVEGYYKYINNISGLKEGSSFLQLIPLYTTQIKNDWDFLVTQGNCWSQGIELSIRQQLKRVSWWLSYSLSKTELQFDALNRGNRYRASYDRTHDFGLFATASAGKHWLFSTNFIYGTGNAISLPSGEYYTIGYTPGSGVSNSFTTVFDYESKNSYRMISYIRWDVAIQYQHRVGKKINGILEISVYNVLNRANPFFYQIGIKNSSDPNSARVIKQTSLFPIMPSISWTIKL